MSQPILLRNANVAASKTFDHTGLQCAHIIVNDKYEHTFPSSSRISKHLSLMTPERLSDRLSDGTFFFHNDEMLDFRDGNYAGFIHEDGAIAELFNHIGVTELVNGRNSSRFSRFATADEQEVKPAMAKIWQSAGLHLSDANIKKGGEFNYDISYVWSPFQSFVGTSIDLIRLICDNGMTARTKILDTKVPLVNRWEQHLNIAAKQTGDKLGILVNERMTELAKVRLNVRQVNLICKHIAERMSHDELENDETMRYMALHGMLSPARNLAEVYTESAISDNRIAAHLDSHISGIDGYNIVTELRSHTFETRDSSNAALDRISNELLFMYEGTDNLFGSSTAFRNDSAFATPNDAFYSLRN